MSSPVSGLLRQSPSWLVSVVVHVTVMFVALMLPMATHVKRAMDLDFAFLGEQEDQSFDASTADQVGTLSENNQYSAFASSNGTVSVQAAVPANAAHAVSEQVGQEFEGPTLGVGDEDPLGEIVDKGVLGNSVDAPGGAVENTTGGTAGAIDRLTQELQLSLRKRKTLAIWLFDSSLSLKDRRAVIAERFENVYKQLDALEASKENGLSTVVASFGVKFNLLTKEPIKDIRQIIPKVKSIGADGGDEYVFGAVKQLVTSFQRYRRDQNVMMIIITDERGSDPQLLDETISLCRKYGIRVYTVGNASLFGREEGFTKYKYDDGFEVEVTMDAGPETVQPELLVLPYWDGNDRDLSRMSSGYGPYGLTRLCRETGGMYFITEAVASQSFDPAVMRNYQPDYRPAKAYNDSMQKSPAKMALVNAAKMTKLEAIPQLTTVFRADSDNALKDEITRAQQPAAVLVYKLNQLYPVLQQGEKDREKVKEARWRAGYDLAMGRVLAMKVRAEGYNKMLAEMKSTPQTFKKKESNQWRIQPAREILAGVEIKKLEKQAVAYLKRVIDEHPGTPWELLAKRELTPMGWHWVEAAADYPKVDPNETDQQKRIRLAKDEEKRKEMMKNAPPPRAPPPKV